MGPTLSLFNTLCFHKAVDPQDKNGKNLQVEQALLHANFIKCFMFAKDRNDTLECPWKHLLPGNSRYAQLQIYIVTDNGNLVIVRVQGEGKE